MKTSKSCKSCQNGRTFPRKPVVTLTTRGTIKSVACPSCARILQVG